MFLKRFFFLGRINPKSTTDSAPTYFIFWDGNSIGETLLVNWPRLTNVVAETPAARAMVAPRLADGDTQQIFLKFFSSASISHTRYFFISGFIPHAIARLQKSAAMCSLPTNMRFVSGR